MAGRINILDVLWSMGAFAHGTVVHLPPDVSGTWRPPSPQCTYGKIGSFGFPSPLCGGRKGATISWSSLDGYWTKKDFALMASSWQEGYGWCKNCIKKYESEMGLKVTPTIRKKFTDADKLPVLFSDQSHPVQPSSSNPHIVIMQGGQPVAQDERQTMTRQEAMHIAELVKKEVLSTRCSIDDGIDKIAVAENKDHDLVSRAFYKYTSPVLVTALTFDSEEG